MTAKRNPQPRTAVLLGAGASVDAGLPVTAKIAKRIIRRANASKLRTPSLAILNVVYGAMSGYTGLRGKNPESAVNIETLISSLRVLQARDEHEVAPFVGSWLSALDDLPVARPNREAARSLIDTLANLDDMNPDLTLQLVHKAVSEIARSDLRPDLTAPLREAEEYVVRQLVDILGGHTTTKYLSPIIDLAVNQFGGADVITLNYDLTVEDAAKGKVSVERGIDSWEPGSAIEFSETNKQLNLIKLHGSLDWHMEESGARNNSLVNQHKIRVLKEPSEFREMGYRPWLVVGDRDKLGTDGPTIELNYAGRTALRRADHLAVVGYSFSDAHINSMLRDWMNNNPARTMTIVDKTWEPFNDSSLRRDKNEFRVQLISHYAARQKNGDPLTPRILPVEGTAEQSLDTAIRCRPENDPDRLVEVHEGSENEFFLTWLGPDLSGVAIHVARDAPGPLSTIRSPGSKPVPEVLRGQPTTYVRFESWRNQEVKPVTITGGKHEGVEVIVTGKSIVGGYRVRCVLEAGTKPGDSTT